MKNNNLKTKLTKIAALVALTVGSGNAFAALNDSVTADATIFNQVVVEYTSTTDATAKYAYDDVAVLVTLLEAPASITYISGDSSTSTGTVKLEYAIDTNANGSDQYTPSVTTTPPADVTISSEVINLLNYDGTFNSVITGVQQTLGGGIAAPLPAGPSNDTIYFPGASDHGFIVGAYVKIGVTVYEVTATTAGTAPFADANGVVTAEVKGTIVLVVPGTLTPVDVSGVAAGTLIQERMYIEVVVTGTNNSPTGTALDVPIDVLIDGDDDDSDGGTNDDSNTDTDGDSNNDKEPTFKAAYLTVTKLVNTDGGATYYVTGDLSLGTVDPGGVLHYQLTIPAIDRSDVDNVIVTDTLPDYTTLVTTINSITITYNDADDSAATGNPVVITVNSPAFAFGTATSFSDDSNTADVFATVSTTGDLSVWLGEGATASTGGEVAPDDTVTITYSVTVD